jgi:hypothetical protein
MDLGLVLHVAFQALHDCSAACANPCVVRKRVRDYMDLVHKVTKELSGRAAFREGSTDETILEIYRTIIVRIWIEEDLEHVEIDRHLTPANARILAAARVIVKDSFEAHANFVTWI